MKKHHHMDVHKQSQCQSYHPQVFGTYLHIKHFSPIKSLDCPFLYPWVLMAKTKTKAAEEPVAVKRRHFEKSPPDSASGSIKVKPFYKDKRFQVTGSSDKSSSDKSGTKERQVSSKARTDKAEKTEKPQSLKSTRPSALKTSAAPPTKQVVNDEEKKNKDKKKRDALKEKIDQLKELESDDGSEKETLDDMDAELNRILEGGGKDKGKKREAPKSENEGSESSEDESGDEDEEDGDEDVSGDDSSNESSAESGQDGEAANPGTAIVVHEDPEPPEPSSLVEKRNSIFPLFG